MRKTREIARNQRELKVEPVPLGSFEYPTEMALAQKTTKPLPKGRKYSSVARFAVIHNSADTEIFIEHPSSSCGGWGVGMEK